jgi:hypothetical protein
MGTVLRIQLVSIEQGHTEERVRIGLVNEHSAHAVVPGNVRLRFQRGLRLRSQLQRDKQRIVV